MESYLDSKRSQIYPITKAVSVTTSDSTNLAEPARSLWVGGAGNVVAVFSTGTGQESAVTFTGVPAGTLLPVNVIRVNATNTTATSILALY